MIGQLQTDAYKFLKRIKSDSGSIIDEVESRKSIDNSIAQSKEIIDSASLVMIPTGSKSGKLYSLKPTDGSGDFTVARNSVKWVRGKDGYYREAPVNVPALEWSPTAQKFGVLAEPQTTNLLLRSWDFNNAYWTKSEATIDNNGGAGYDCPFNSSGVNLKRGFKLIENNINTVHYIQASNITKLDAKVYTESVLVKYAGRRWIYLQSYGPIGRTWFDLLAGVVGTQSALHTSTSITHIVDGWYECTITYTSTTTNGRAYVFLASDNNIISYIGDGTSGIYICQAQLEQATTASSPIFTDGATVTRLADVATVTIPAGVTKITTTVNGVDVVDNSPTPGATYTAPNGLISKIIME